MHEQASKLFCPITPPVLYHYCSPESFISIVKHAELWLTDFAKMNDYEEEIWAAKQVYKAHKHLEKNEDVSPSFKEYYHRRYESRRIAIRKFLCCFSEDGDTLSQWRAYGANGSGFAIGFNPEKLEVVKDIPTSSSPDKKTKYLVKVCYDEDEQSEFITTCVSTDKNAADYTEFGTAWLLAHTSIAMKHYAFQEEKEWRIVYSPTFIEKNYDNVTNSVYFRASNRGVVPYFTHRFPFEALTQVVIGPTNQTTEEDLELFLGNFFFKDVDIVRAAATYRG